MVPPSRSRITGLVLARGRVPAGVRAGEPIGAIPLAALD